MISAASPGARPRLGDRPAPALVRWTSARAGWCGTSRDRTASAPAQVLGSWNGRAGTFVWAWDNADAPRRGSARPPSGPRPSAWRTTSLALTDLAARARLDQVRDLVALAFRVGGCTGPAPPHRRATLRLRRLRRRHHPAAPAAAPPTSRCGCREPGPPAREPRHPRAHRHRRRHGGGGRARAACRCWARPVLLAWCEAATCAALAAALDDGRDQRRHPGRPGAPAPSAVGAVVEVTAGRARRRPAGAVHRRRRRQGGSWSAPARSPGSSWTARSSSPACG